MDEQVLEINGNIYRLKIHFERRKFSRASVSRNSINIRIPTFMPEPWKTMEISKLKKWAIEKINSNPSKFTCPGPVKYENGKQINIAGKPFELHIDVENRAKAFAKISGNDIIIKIPPTSQSRIGKILSKLISKEFFSFTEQRLKYLNEIHFQKQLGKGFLKNNKSTWGSCAPNGDITLATKLLLAPSEIIDYVMIHELAHLVVRGHSRKFWKVVGKALPDYREKRKWLRKNGDLFRF